ncbi:aspartate kinase [Bacillus coahuilensis p1.1.43]|uniref:Aspartokinase n=1 Tax=Bacillus coahuilensis p1.1.43 TaxID=1150625 RepID=A0A147K774_9BACI|nr:aspartate kinase [Bacillus coahuilensis]KUP05915.1 aspartate kinase [Bacillus coahuilensis p1.1.43]
MALIVQKFGGTSVGSIERIQNVATIVEAEKNKGNRIVVVVSAMGKTTDQLVSLAGQLTGTPSKREMDMLLSTGEQVTISLLAMALQARGHQAISYTGWQAGIMTEAVPSNARIEDIQTEKIHSKLETEQIVIVAGFQGISADGEITTLGRGGSDTTAVALAAKLGADRCDIYTDVDGVYTSDPRVVGHARKLSTISYDEMLELANLGAGVLHPRAVEFAKNYHVELEVRSSMVADRGTMITEENAMEDQLIVKGIAFEKNVARITLFGLTEQSSGLGEIFSALALEQIDVDIIIHSQLEDGSMNLSFTVNSEDVEQATNLLVRKQEVLGFKEIEFEEGLAKVSAVGSGMISNPGVAAKIFTTLSGGGIPVKMVSTSEIKVSVIVSNDLMEKASNVLHDQFICG